MIPQLHQMLRRMNRLTMLADVGARAGRGAALVVAAVLGAIFADAMFGFPAPVLRGIGWALLALAVLAVAAAGRVALRHRYDPRRLARYIESRMDLRDSRLINAVELAGDSGAGAIAMSAALRELAVNEGRALAAKVNPPEVLDPRPLRRSILTAAGALGAACVAYLLAPQLFAAVVPRYLHPSADLPPFTRVNFDVSVEPGKIYHGQPATIRVKLSGPTAPDRAAVVFAADSGGRERVAMMREMSGAHVLPLERAELSRRFYIDTPAGRSGWRTLSVLPVPIFKGVTVRYGYPAYTRWPAVERRLDDKGVRAIAGTTLGFRVASNLPLSAGRLIVRSRGQVAETTLSPTEDPSVVSGELELRSDGEFELTLLSRDGIPSESPLHGTLHATADHAPQVQLLQPDLRVMAPRNFRLPVTVAAHDDVGLGRIDLHYRVNDGPTQRLPLELRRKAPTYATGQGQLDLQTLGARPGDTVRGFATAYDNHPDPANSADSVPFEVAVLSDEQYAELAREQYRMEQVAEEAANLAARLDALDEQREKLRQMAEALRQKLEQSGGELSAEDRRAMQQLQAALEAYEQASAELAQEMHERAQGQQAYDFEKAYTQQLGEHAQNLHRQAEAAKSVRQAMEPGDAQKLAQLTQQLQRDAAAAGADRQQRQLTEQQLRQVAAAEKLADEAEAIKDIATRQREIAEQLSPLRDRALSSDEAARAQRLAREQDGLRRELEESMARLEQAAAEASELLPRMSTSARDVAQKLKDLAVPADQRRATDAATRGRGTQAYQSADIAAKKLASMIGACNGMCSGNSEDLDGNFGLSRSAMQNALGQLGRRPGSGSGSGAGSGTGSGGRMGRGSGKSAPGAGGSQARLMGPHDRASRESSSRGERGAGAFGRAGETPDTPAGDTTQHLAPEARSIQSGTGSTRGVPLQYRGLAERYFRRLAEETR